MCQCVRSRLTVKTDVAKNCLHHSLIEPLQCLQRDGQTDITRTQYMTNTTGRNTEGLGQLKGIVEYKRILLFLKHTLISGFVLQ